MRHSFSLHTDPDVSQFSSNDRQASSEEIPTVDFLPAEIVRYRTAQWRGLYAKTVQLISHEQFEYRFKEQFHLLIAVEQGVRYDGETFIEGLPPSTMRNYSRRLIFVAAGRSFFGVQKPRLLTRSTCFYIDPRTVLADPDLRFAERALEPRLLFEDAGIWQTTQKLNAQIGSADPGDRMYADALSGVLAHEVMRLQGMTSVSRPGARGGLAPWQQKRVLEFMEEHPAENVALHALADLVRLSPYHFVRSFKQSFGEPPHRYWTRRRIERAKTLLADPRASVTGIAFDVGYAGTSAFSATFRRLTGLTPTQYRRALE
jgi:AraC family transcriptional regulator